MSSINETLLRKLREAIRNHVKAQVNLSGCGTDPDNDRATLEAACKDAKRKLNHAILRIEQRLRWEP